MPPLRQTNTIADRITRLSQSVLILPNHSDVNCYNLLCNEIGKRVMSEEETTEKEQCHLYQVRGIEAWCTRDKCIYWRLLEAQDAHAPNNRGCGLQHYGLIDEITPEMTEWLLSMKKRLENTTPEAGKARITFRRREEK